MGTVVLICRHCGGDITSDEDEDYLHEPSGWYSCNGHAADNKLPVIYPTYCVAEPMLESDIIDKVLTKYEDGYTSI